MDLSVSVPLSHVEEQSLESEKENTAVLFPGNFRPWSGSHLLEPSGRCSQEWPCVSSSSAAFQVAKLEIWLKGALFSEVTVAQLCSVTATEQGTQNQLGAREGSAPTKPQASFVDCFSRLVIFSWILQSSHGDKCWKSLSVWLEGSGMWSAGCWECLSLNATGCITTAASF